MNMGSQKTKVFKVSEKELLDSRVKTTKLNAENILKAITELTEKK